MTGWPSGYPVEYAPEDAWVVGVAACGVVAKRAEARNAPELAEPLDVWVGTL